MTRQMNVCYTFTLATLGFLLRVAFSKIQVQQGHPKSRNIVNSSRQGQAIKGRENGDKGLFITLVPNVL